MEINEQVIRRFYTAFQQLDYKTMQDCYSDNIVFSDPVFMILNGNEAKSMWEMLCTSAKDLSLTFGPIELLDEEYATCPWTATYTFSKTGRKVTNRIKAFMKLRDGKIIEHSDAFRLSTWIAQAFGWKGVLFGWSGFMKKKVQNTAKKNLFHFMEKKQGELST